jgi:hypothetical protein
MPMRVTWLEISQTRTVEAFQINVDGGEREVLRPVSTIPDRVLSVVDVVVGCLHWSRF